MDEIMAQPDEQAALIVPQAMKEEIGIIRARYDKQIAVALEHIYDLRKRRTAAVEKAEKRMIKKALKECNWRTDRASEALGISVVTLWRRAKYHGVKR